MPAQVPDAALQAAKPPDEGRLEDEGAADNSQFIKGTKNSQGPFLPAS